MADKFTEWLAGYYSWPDPESPPSELTRDLLVDLRAAWDAGAASVRLIRRVITVLAQTDHDCVFWREDNGNLRALAICNDVFDWGTADCEEVTNENIGMLEAAAQDCIAAGVGHLAFYLFCARVRKMRPQGAMYRYLPREAWPLFDACGPDREVDVTNPLSRERVIELLEEQEKQKEAARADAVQPNPAGAGG